MDCCLHRICKRITEYITSKKYSEEDLRVVKICYGIENFFSELLKNVILIIFFFILGYGIEYLVCMFTVFFIRQFMGGIHMKSALGCLLFSLSVYSVTIAADTYLIIPIPLRIMFAVTLLILMILFAPIPSPNRPRYSVKKRRTIKLSGVLGIGITLMGSVIFHDYSNCVFWIYFLQIVEVMMVKILEITTN